LNVRWRIYYGDDSTFSDEDGDPSQAPALDVQVVAVADETVGRFFYSQRDYYWYDTDGGVWYAADLFGLWDYLARPGWKRVLFGRTRPRAEFEAVFRQAMADDYLPVKSAWDEREARPW
jgi:hypothetical protein